VTATNSKEEIKMLLSGGFEYICQKAISCIWKTQINRIAAKARAISTYP